MLNLFKKRIDKNIYAPVKGKQILLKDVPDKIFATKMMGDGVAFEFDGDTVCAPCQGTITAIADSKHAFGIQVDNGAEILIHVGLDTVNLQGQGFDVKVKVGSKVKHGDPLVVLDRKLFKENGINLITPLILTNCHDIKYKVFEKEENVNEQAVVIEIE